VFELGNSILSGSLNVSQGGIQTKHLTTLFSAVFVVFDFIWMS